MANVLAPLLVVLYEGHGSEPLAAAVRSDVLRRLLAQGHHVARVRPLARLSDATRQRILVVGQFAAELPEELAAAGATKRFQLLSVAGMDAEQIVAAVDAAMVEAGDAQRPAWKPWFPVIDYDRCTNCMQCLSFCLFEVYGVSSDAKIQVQHQSNCKTDCPACSRVCPEVAILFPKYKAGPINGDEVNSEDVRREAMKVDISALLGGDIYALLRDRSERAKSRFSKERDEERALKERKRCLDKLQGELEVPMEVMAALPSVEEIQAKAEQARARAEQARQDAARQSS